MSLFKVSSHHAGQARPPEIDGDVGTLYHGYFENSHGGQLVFVFDCRARMGTLWVGGADWQRFDVTDGICAGVVLDDLERRWLQVCWESAVRFLDPPRRR